MPGTITPFSTERGDAKYCEASEWLTVDRVIDVHNGHSAACLVSRFLGIGCDQLLVKSLRRITGRSGTFRMSTSLVMKRLLPSCKAAAA